MNAVQGSNANGSLKKKFAVAVLACGAVAAALHFMPSAGNRALSGYVVSRNLYPAAPVSAPVSEIYVTRGQQVSAGAPLFSLDTAILAARKEAALADLARAGTAVDEALAAHGRAEAMFIAAQSENARATRNEARKRALLKTRAVSEEDHDAALARAEQAVQEEKAASLDLVAAGHALEGTRHAQRAAEATVDEAGQALRDAAPLAPTDAVVEEVFYQKGEWVAANVPVLGLVPDNERRVRFFVPQAERPRFAPGAQVFASCDGCPAPLPARVDYVSPRPEYTPPVIYSRENREKMVFMVEAVFDRADVALLAPGLPMDVVLAESPAPSAPPASPSSTGPTGGGKQ